MIDVIRQWLRRRRWWVRFRELNREGWGNVWKRMRLETRILDTPPVMTEPPGSGAACEVHILTWQRDFLMGLWAAKTFYAHAEVRWPLVWHQGGFLSMTARRLLAKHFPNSRFLAAEEATPQVEALLEKRNLKHCLEGRRRSFMLIKLLDCLLLSEAPYMLLLDTDILFFARPTEIIEAVAGCTSVSLFNRDQKNYYNLTPEMARSRYGLEMADRLNTGLGLVCRTAFDLQLIETLLADPDLFENPWLTEQTLYALLAGKYGVAFLPDTYLVSTRPGLHTVDGRPLVAKHYPSHPRPLLFQEGMAHLVRNGFLARFAPAEEESRV